MCYVKLPLILLILYFSYVLSKENDTSTEHHRKERVNGRIVKLYSGSKPDPILCHKEGFQADFDDCSIFYRCLKANNEKFTVFRFQCAPGTIFDADKDVCNYPQNTRRSDCGLLANTEGKHDKEIENIQQELPQPIKTTKVPQSYIDLNKPSPFGHYNEFADSQDPVPQYLAVVSNKYENLTTSSPTAVSSIGRVTQSTNIQHQNNQEGDPCVTHGFMGDTRNCKKFYRCVNNLRGGYIRYEFLCSDATIWDDSTQGCNHAWLVRNTRCRRGNTYTENVDDTFGIKKQTETVPVNVLYEHKPQNNYMPVNQIQPQGETNIILDNQTQLYDKISVSVGEPSQMPSTQRATTGYTSAQINYGDKIMHDYLSHTPLRNNQSNIHNIEYKEEEKLQLNNNNYNDRCNKNGFFGYNDDCNKFYRCVENSKGSYTKYEFSCSEGTVWDDSVKACNFAWAVKECGNKKSNLENKIIPTTESHNFNTFTSPGAASDVDIGYGLIYEQSLSPLIGTSNITPGSFIHTTTTSNDILEQDYDYGYQQHKSTNKNIVSTTETINNIIYKPLKTVQNKCTKSGFMGDNTDCNKFYRCVDSGKGTFIQYEFSCGEGTVWDSRIESCNHAWAVEQCGQNVPVRSTTNANEIGDITQGNYEKATSNNTTILGNYPNTVTVFQPTQATNIYIPSTTLHPIVNTESPDSVDKVSTIRGENCLKEGFYPYVEDCRKFYRCVNNGLSGYDRYDFTCGEGTAWDVTINSCNHIENVKTCRNSQANEIQEENKQPIKDNDHTLGETSTTTSIKSTPSMGNTESNYTPTNENTYCNQAGYFGDVNDCKKFYRCVNDGKDGFIKYEYLCGEGTIWDQDITACNHPRDVKRPSCLQESSNSSSISSIDIISQSTSTTKTSAITGPSSISSPSTVGTEGVSIETATSSVTSLKPSSDSTKQTCNEEGFFGDINDCKSFYRCVYNGKDGFIKYDFTCGEGTIWDQDIVACNHPKDVEHPSCSLGSTSSSKTTSADLPTSSSVTTEKVSTSTMIISSPSSQSTTAKQTSWSTENSIKQNSTTQQGSEQASTSSTTTTPTSEHIKPTNQDFCSEEGFFGNSNDCKMFYRCVSNGKDGFIKYDFTCGEGTIWDKNIVACNHPQDVEHPSCSLESTAISKTTNADLSTSPGFTTEISTTTMIISSSLSQSTTAAQTSWSTVNNIKQNSTTQQASEQTSTISSATTTTTTTPTTGHMKPNNQDSCSEEGFFGSSNDCKKFYRCVYNGKDGFIKYDFTCGEGTIWDQDITACNHPGDVENSSCSTESTHSSSTTSKEFSSSTDSTTTSTRYPSSSSKPTATTDDNNWSTENNENGGFTEQQEKGNFTCTKAGFYPNPNDCKKFYRCVDWNNDGSSFSIFHFECGEGTIWDPALDTCNYEDSVYPARNCSGSQSQIQNNTENTTQKSTTSASTTMSTEQTKTTEQQTTTSTQATTQEVTSTESTTTQQTTSTDSTITTAQQTSSTEKSTTSSTDQSSPSTTSVQETTTTERSTTATDQTTQTEKVTEESTTSEGTTQLSTTEQQSTSTTETSIEATENDKTTTESSQPTTENNTPSSNKCPDMDENQYPYVCPTSFRRHPKYCNLFYQCTEDDDSHDLKIAMFHCPNDTIYDESKTQCVNESKSEKKCDGTIAQTHRIKRLSGDFIEPVTVDKKSYACPGTGYFPFEDTQECSPAFLKCQRSKTNKFKGYVFKCPKGFTFWTVSKRCERMTRVRDCDRTDYPWNNRYDIPTEIRNVAP